MIHISTQRIPAIAIDAIRERNAAVPNPMWLHGDPMAGHLTVARQDRAILLSEVDRLAAELKKYQSTGLTPDEVDVYVACQGQQVSRRELRLLAEVGRLTADKVQLARALEKEEYSLKLMDEAMDLRYQKMTTEMDRLIAENARLVAKYTQVEEAYNEKQRCLMGALEESNKLAADKARLTRERDAAREWMCDQCRANGSGDDCRHCPGEYLGTPAENGGKPNATD